MKRHYQTTLALSLVIGIGAHMAYAAEFSVTVIPPPQLGYGTVITGINNSGQITGYYGKFSSYPFDYLPPTHTQAFLYQNGTATLLPFLPNCTESTASAINSSGQIVGVQTDADGKTHPYLYSSNTVTELPMADGSFPRAINDNADIAGVTQNSTTNGAFLYHNGTQTSLITSNPSTSMVDAYGINNDDIVVGYGQPASGVGAFRYQNGVTTDLGNLGTSTSVADSLAFAVNASGQIAGMVSTSTGNHAFLYQNGQFMDLGTLPNTLVTDATTSSGKLQSHYSIIISQISSFATALNNVGQSVGYATYSGIPGDQPNHAWIYSGFQLLDLNRLSDLSNGKVLLSAVGINDYGQIITLGPDNTAYLLTPRIQTVATAPPDLTADGVSGTQIQLRWTSAIGAGYYKIFRSATANGPMVEIGESDDESYLDTLSDAGASAYYAVSSVNSHGISPKSAPVMGTTLAVPPSDAPTLAGSQYSSYGNHLSWTVVPTATRYTIFRAVHNGIFSQVTSTASLSFTDSGLQPSTHYDYYVVAENAYGAGPQSNTVTVITLEARPTIRPIVTATAVSSTEIDLTWTTDTPNAFYTVSRSTASGGPKTFLAGGVSGGSWHDTLDLKPGTNYFYTVQVSTSGGAGPTSIEASATTFGIPSHATSLEAHPVNATEIDLSWARIPGATSYRILRSLTPGGPHQFIGAVTNLSFHNVGLPPATKYYYVVSGLNSYGESPKSPEASATTLALPSAPVSLTAEAANCSQINLHWTASSGASSYQIYRSSAPGAAHRYVGTTTALQFADKSLAPNTAFYYVVVALNSHGRSPNSNEAHAKTLALPSTPLNLTASAVSKSRIDLHWTAAFGASSYQIFRATASGASHTYIGTTVNQQFGSTGLAASTSYYYVVVAVNANGSGPKSNEAGAKTLAH